MNPINLNRLVHALTENRVCAAEKDGRICCTVRGKAAPGLWVEFADGRMLLGAIFPMPAGEDLNRTISTVNASLPVGRVVANRDHTRLLFHASLRLPKGGPRMEAMVRAIRFYVEFVSTACTQLASGRVGDRIHWPESLHGPCRVHEEQFIAAMRRCGFGTDESGG